jgi:hypothetical protein
MTAATPATGTELSRLVSSDFEDLRWFELPAECLAPQ